MTHRAPEVDLLTGAYLRPHFEALLAQAVSGCRARPVPLALLYLDADELQEHNDSHGLDTVDAALSRLVEQLGAELDGRGAIGRLQGGTFAVILEDLPQGPAAALAERLRHRIATQAHPSGSGHFRLTVSIGLARMRRSEPWGNLLEAAATACLRAKQAGRNRVMAREQP